MLDSELGFSCFLRLSELEFELQGSIFNAAVGPESPTSEV